MSADTFVTINICMLYYALLYPKRMLKIYIWIYKCMYFKLLKIFYIYFVFIANVFLNNRKKWVKSKKTVWIYKYIQTIHQRELNIYMDYCILFLFQKHLTSWCVLICFICMCRYCYDESENSLQVFLCNCSCYCWFCRFDMMWLLLF